MAVSGHSGASTERARAFRLDYHQEEYDCDDINCDYDDTYCDDCDDFDDDDCDDFGDDDCDEDDGDDNLHTLKHLMESKVVRGCKGVNCSYCAN